MTGESGLQLLGVERDPAEDGAAHLALHTDGGVIHCRFHDAPPGEIAVLWVFGAGGGLGGPAGGVYTRLARQLTGDGIASLELDYRRAGDLAACRLDVAAGLEYLASLGRIRVVLVGHSLGGAVVIGAGAVTTPVGTGASASVIAVAALSSTARGTETVGQLSPRPFLVLHGTDDEVVPAARADDIFERAGEPKRLILYPGCRHGLDECRDALDRDLLAWLREVTDTGR